MSASIRIGSAFSGIGGLEYGLEEGFSSYGIRADTVWQIEKTQYARDVLARHWPNAERYSDVRSIKPDELQPVDLICGGFPCQDISIAGKGAGIEGSRSGLFWELHRIILQMGPRWIVLENVPAIRERGGREVCGSLAGIGYNLRWFCISATASGAPHRRKRWICIGWLANSGRIGVQLCGKSGEFRCPQSSATGETSQRQRSGAGALSGGKAGLDDPSSSRQQRQGRCLNAVHSAEDRKREADRIINAGEGAIKPGMGRTLDGVPSRLDRHQWPAPPGEPYEWEEPRTRPQQPFDKLRLTGLGNAVVPHCAAAVAGWIVNNPHGIPVL